jgi:IclR family acetate operon transcriptional repressor
MSDGEHQSNSPTSRYTVRAVDRVCDILEIVSRGAPAVSLPDIVELSGLPKSSTFRYLTTLEHRRFVERTADGMYRLGSAMARSRVNDLGEMVVRMHSVLEALRDEFGETANFGILDGKHVSYLDIVESRRSVRLVAHAGTRDELHCTALGKAIIATWSDEQVKALIGETYESRTPRTLRTWQDLERNLSKVREVGYSVDDEENEVGGRCVAVKVPGMDAAVSVSAPISRIPYELVDRVGRTIANLLMSFSE